MGRLIVLVVVIAGCGPSGPVPVAWLCEGYGARMCDWENMCGLDNPCNDAVEEAEWADVCLSVFEECHGVAEVDADACFAELEAMTCEDLVYPMECYESCE